MIDETIKQARQGRNGDRRPEENSFGIVLPYIWGTTDKIAEILRRRNLKVCFSPPNSIRNMLYFSKDAIEPKHHQGVYAIPCSIGKVYIGELGHSIKTRLKEYNTYIHHGRIKKSSITEHTSNHEICLEDSKVLPKIPHYYKWKIREDLEIERFDNNVNRDDGLKLKEAWKQVVHHIKTNQPPQRDYQHST